jgi:hypothetical protein
MTTQQIETDWTFGDGQTLAVVRPGPAELGSVLGIRWQRAYDDLDYFDFAVLPSSTGRVFALRRYCGMPTPGTEIVVNLGLSRPECSLEEALAVLGLTVADVTWTGPIIGDR